MLTKSHVIYKQKSISIVLVYFPEKTFQKKDCTNIAPYETNTESYEKITNAKSSLNKLKPDKTKTEEEQDKNMLGRREIKSEHILQITGNLKRKKVGHLLW